MHIALIAVYTLISIAVTPANAQLGLPQCPSSKKNVWTNCQGSENFGKGYKYIGEFKNSKFHGHGTLTSPHGTKYVGEFKDSSFDGKGTYTNANGDVYTGQFKANKFNGQGTFVWASGDQYSGDWKDDTKNGQGTFTWADGFKYVGDFKDDLPNWLAASLRSKDDKQQNELGPRNTQSAAITELEKLLSDPNKTRSICILSETINFEIFQTTKRIMFLETPVQRIQNDTQLRVALVSAFSDSERRAAKAAIIRAEAKRAEGYIFTPDDIKEMNSFKCVSQGIRR